MVTHSRLRLWSESWMTSTLVGQLRRSFKLSSRPSAPSRIGDWATTPSVVFRKLSMANVDNDS